MTIETFTARDMATAMALVADTLGDEALILSTRKQGGQVVIDATTDPVAARHAMAKPVVSAPTPAQQGTQPSLFAKALAEEEARQRLVSRLQSGGFGAAAKVPSNVVQMGERPAPRGPRRDTQAIWRAHRIFVVGPAGAGKSLFAARLAAHILTTHPERRVQLGLADAPNRAAAALMQQKARLMGLGFQQGRLADVPQDCLIGQPTEIIEVNTDSKTALDLLKPLSADPLTVVICVVPAGMAPAALRTELAQWSVVSSHAVMTRLDHWPPTSGEVEALAQTGYRLAWTAAGTAVLDSLSAPVPHDLPIGSSAA